jgi:hypothetical protein
VINDVDDTEDDEDSDASDDDSDVSDDDEEVGAKGVGFEKVMSLSKRKVIRLFLFLKKESDDFIKARFSP